jgi:hypothetical protein
MATAKQSKTSPKASNASKPRMREQPTTKRRPPKTISKPTALQAKAASVAALSATDVASAPPFRSGSKGAKVVDLLRHKDGATVAEMTSATGWQKHSVRGFLSGSLKKKLGLEVTSAKGADDERRYRIDS